MELEYRWILFSKRAIRMPAITVTSSKANLAASVYGLASQYPFFESKLSVVISHLREIQKSMYEIDFWIHSPLAQKVDFFRFNGLGIVFHF